MLESSTFRCCLILDGEVVSILVLFVRIHSSKDGQLLLLLALVGLELVNCKDHLLENYVFAFAKVEWWERGS